ncbi:MAG: sensor signal transduction histidine kinase [Brevundimonas sp.]|nr:sensor signal transduction histidine kinase [Brevundimonas sp.]
MTTEDLDLYNSAPFGDLLLGPDGRITMVNATFAAWVGFPAEALAGRRLRDLLTIPTRILYETNVAPVLKLQGGFEEVSFDLLTASGDKLPVLANALERRGGDGQVLFTRVGVMRARERRGYEQALKGRAAEAVGKLTAEQETAQLREQFIAVLGHDLRNPLASIVGAARLLRREGQSEKALKILTMMEASVDRMAGLIDDVMDFARGRLGSGIGLHRSLAPLEPVLRQVVEELEANHRSRDIICELDVSEVVSFDAGRIGQLVSNLLGNALVHGDPKAAVRLGAVARAGAFQVWVVNTGPAIPAQARERLFQPFFRGEVRASQQGLGLGLHIASEIARAHGGTLTVASDETETRFTLDVPPGGRE